MNKTGVDDGGLAHLKEAAALTNLNVYTTNVTDAKS